jgi:hypothetical protein
MSPVLKAVSPTVRLGARTDDYEFPDLLILHEDDLLEIDAAMANLPAPSATLRALFKNSSCSPNRD